MRFRPFSERTQLILLSPIIVPLCISLLPFITLVPVAWAFNKIGRWIGDCRKARGWHGWFAWRPVRLSGFHYDRDDQFAWFETVDRKWLSGWSYRFPGELDVWERRELEREKNDG